MREAREQGGAKVWILAMLVALPASLGLLIGVGCAIGANSCPFTDAEPFTSIDGPEIWRANCALCHGPDANGSANNPDAPSLVEGELALLTQQELIAKIGRGRPLAGMPRFRGVLTEEQLAAVAAFIIGSREARDG